MAFPRHVAREGPHMSEATTEFISNADSWAMSSSTNSSLCIAMLPDKSSFSPHKDSTSPKAPKRSEQPCSAAEATRCNRPHFHNFVFTKHDKVVVEIKCWI